MKQKVINSIIIYTLLSVFVLGSMYSAYKVNTHRKVYVEDLVVQSYKQPTLRPGNYPWDVRSIDTQVVSKHWPDVSREAVREQVALLEELGVNYIAIGTPYDRVEDMRIWVEEIHAAGLNVWFRSHWARWEGDEGMSATMRPDEYLDSTYKFIITNPDLFQPGDAFTVAVEAEQVGVGLGKRFLTWEEYREFLLSEIRVANLAFEEIGLGSKIHTNWLSVNGWVVDNVFTPEFAQNLELVVVDHFVEQSQTIGELNEVDLVVNKTIEDLDRFYEKHGVPILLGEWGYQIFQPVSDELQAEVVDKLFAQLVSKEYLVGVNYWVHMGNTASIIGDEYGSNLELRNAAYVIQNYFRPIITNGNTNQ